MAIRRMRGDVIIGIAVSLVIAVPFSLCLAGYETTKILALPPDEVHIQGRSLWLPIPECDRAELQLDCGGRVIAGNLTDTAYLRDQKIGLFELPEEVAPQVEVDVVLKFAGARSEQCVDAGPLTRVLDRTLTGYGLVPAPTYHAGPGSVARCQTLNECANVKPDVLLIAGHCLFPTAYVDSLALLWADRMGLNVAIIDVASISLTSPVIIRDFIKNLYDLACAEHFGDGHLGFVALLGDAYEDDNVTVMVPDYDGYGGTSEASDHYYACLAGNDDFEDVMLGRIPVGNLQELVNYYNKLVSYTPVPAGTWSHSVLLLGGCYFASKADYVDLFDNLQADVSSDFSVSRWYRYDYPLTASGDAAACQAVTDSLNKGCLIAIYAGDGDKWDWGGTTKRAFRSANISSLNNASRLPIVLSIACSNGWFDNNSQLYGDLGVDCFAERLLVAPSGGAVACLASSREVGGGAATIFAPQLIKSAFLNGSSFLGELVLEAKTRHLLNLGSVAYVRQFNLFGDPCLNFILNSSPMSLPDLVIRPYHVTVSPEFPGPGDPLTISGEVWNASGAYVSSLVVGLYAGRPDSGGMLLDFRTLTGLYPWEKRTVSFSVNNLLPGNHEFSLVADPSQLITESDETNNLVDVETYVYPCQDGFPIKVGDDVKGQVIADLNNDGEPEILVISGGCTAEAIDHTGCTLWARKDLGLSFTYDGIEPAAADLNGDGTTECVIPLKSGVAVVDGATGVTRWKVYTDYPCLSPVVADLDGDGTFEVLLATYAGSSSKLLAYNASGAARWTYTVPGSGSRLTGLVVCDRDLDGKKEIIYSTGKGSVTCLSCQAEPPTVAWTQSLSSQAVTSIVAGDLERDGAIEVIASHDSTITVIGALDGGVESRIRVSPCQWSLSLGDVDGDGALEIVCASSCGEIGEIDQGSMVLDLLVDGTPYRSPVLADMDGDGQSEIIFATTQGSLRIIKLDGTSAIAPIPLRGTCLVTPIAGNIDADASIEVVAGSADSLLFVVDLATQGGNVEWPCAGASCQRTGLHAQPLFGQISRDLTLSGRLDVVGDIDVLPGSTLTLERTSDLHLVTDRVSPLGSYPGQCELVVEGSCIARGTHSGRVTIGPASYPAVKNSWQGIIFKQGSSGSLTETSISGAVNAIDCQSSQVQISECDIRKSSTGIRVISASPSIDSDVLASDDYGISVSAGSPTIVNNTITSSLYAGIMLSNGCSADLESNAVSQTSQGNGLAVYSSTPRIGAGNRFESNLFSGIYLSNSSPAIDSCWIAFNDDCGLKATYYSNPVVENTSLVSNRYGVGVYVSSNPILGDTASGLGGNNDIRQNLQYAVYDKTSNRIKAQGNWWGGDPQASMFVGQVDYSGWLNLAPAGVDTKPGEATLVGALRPNPFSRSISFSLNILPADRPFAVAIYDVGGRLVRELASGDHSGKISLEWDGLDMFGNRAASGTYFVSVRTRARTEARKIVLLR